MNYCGPFTPPPADMLREVRAIGWRFLKRYPTRDRWEPVGWEIVYPGGILSVGLDGIPFRDSTLFDA